MAQILWQGARLRPGEAEAHRHLGDRRSAQSRRQVERFVRAGINMSNGFGMSRTGSNFGMPMDDPERVIAKAGCCGLPYVSVEAKEVGEKARISAPATPASCGSPARA
jgi:fatty-acyl-CoA synthase